MRYSNLHTHSIYSDGKYTLEENIQAAIEKHMVSIGFSDHSFTGCDTSYCMRQKHYSDYFNELARLKEKYSGTISIYSGLELDYYSVMPANAISMSCPELSPSTRSCPQIITDDAALTNLHQTFPYDYLLAAIHYIVKNGVCYPIDHSAEQQRDCIQNAFGGDIFAMVQCYFDMFCEHVKRVKPTVVGHFDVLTKFHVMPEDDERYLDIARSALKRIIRTCPYIEVNTGAIARGWRTTPYPAQNLWHVILEEGGEVVLGSDSHHKDNLTFYFDETVKLLKQAGFDHICMFNGSGFDRIVI